MDMSTVKNKINQIMQQNGVQNSDSQINSITYISIICDIEEFFNIVLPDELLNRNILKNSDVVANYIIEHKMQNSSIEG